MRKYSNLAIEISLTLSQLTSCGLSPIWIREPWDHKGQNADDLRTRDRETTPEFGNFTLASLETYKDCDDLRDSVRTLAAQAEAASKARASEVAYDQANGAPVANKGSTPAPTAAPAQREDVTNSQEKGVNEADRFKVNNHHIYVTNRAGIHVVDRANLAEIGVISDSQKPRQELYASGDKLVILSSEPQPGHSDVFLHAGNPPPPTQPPSIVRIYRASKGAMPNLERTLTLSGAIISSRMVKARLVVILDSYLPTESVEGRAYTLSKTWAPKTVDGRVHDVRCDRLIRQPIVEEMFPSDSLQEIVVIDTDDNASEPMVVATHDGGSQVYMGQEALYLYKSWFRPWWHQHRGSPDPKEPSEVTVVTKVSFNPATGEPVVTARGAVPGRVKDQWAFHEIADADILAVASTAGHVTRGGPEGAPSSSNHLALLGQRDQRLAVVSKVEAFGLNEDIRAVRYVGNTAYVVTFKKTDPLFAFDLSDPNNPTELGELKIPGFSVYMHPLAANRLLGVGFDAADMGDFGWFQGLQISLFDVGNPKEMKRVDNHIIGGRGSYSDITSDHHAFAIDSPGKHIAIPLVELGYSQPPAEKWQIADTLKFSGAVVFEVERDALKDVAHFTHTSIMPDNCRGELAQGRWWQDGRSSMDINRVAFIDDRILSVSRFGVIAYAASAPFAEAGKLSFKGGESECGPPSG